jgi:hypothetical protein
MRINWDVVCSEMESMEVHGELRIDALAVRWLLSLHETGVHSLVTIHLSVSMNIIQKIFVGILNRRI